MTEFVLGGIAAAGACLFTNPIDVMKTRIQLQGELTRGQKKHYRNMFHGFYVLVKEEGFLAMQKGLVPAMWYQFYPENAENDRDSSDDEEEVPIPTRQEMMEHFNKLKLGLVARGFDDILQLKRLGAEVERLTRGEM
ncbi:unnamed protein product [Cyprideis torosa]|uniref:Uncharacterized protein n=1 Tax=Cyprideis torosa TaxID=163714 RepID=A0A7R8W5T0_9CRUS|nr:unnamed protein product [Cyprideis torosa]CAG0884672.1 unnamed protein product [Cyprideis torosa]